MDVEKIIKINEMTKTLKEHGMIEDPSKNDQADRELRGGHGVTQSYTPVQPTSDSSLTKDQLEIALERNTRKIMEIVNNMRTEIIALKQKIAELDARPPVIEKQIVQSSPHEPVIREPSQPAVQEQVAPSQPVAQQPATREEPKKDATGRRGNPSEFTEEQVSVENIFYYGKK